MEIQSGIVIEVKEESLEQMIGNVQRRHTREEDDLEAGLDDLIEEMADRSGSPLTSDGPVRRNEFVCRACHLVKHRSRLAGPDDLLCRDCSPAMVRIR